MTDDTVVLPPDPANPAASVAADPSAVSDPGAQAGAGAAPGPSPLDILEQILNESKQGDKGGGATPSDAPAQPAPSPVPVETPPAPQVDPEELARREAEEAAKLEAQRQELATIKDTPQYHAKVEQEEAQKVASQSAAQSGQGYEIVQLSHKKI